MSMNNPYGGAGGFGGSARPSPSPSGDPAGFNQAPNPLIGDEYMTALIRAIKMAGYNPSSPSPTIAKLFNRGKQLVQELLLEVGKPGGNPDAATSAPDMLNMLAGLIRSAMTGGKVFGGAGKEDALQNLMSLVAGSGSDQGTVGKNFLAALFSDPNSASNLFQEARYGNLAEPFQRTAARSLVDLLDTYSRQQEANPDAVPNFLATLLGKPGGSLSVGAPSMLPSGLGGGAGGATPGAPAGIGAPGAAPGQQPFQPLLGGAPMQPIPPAIAAGGQDPTQILRQMQQLGAQSYLTPGAGY